MLPNEVLHEIIRHASPDGTAFLIGGQALNFWAERYSVSAPELSHYGPFVSKDVDFFGTVDAARKLAAALKGRVRVPATDNHTPQSAIVSAVVLGLEVEIDFLWNVLGPPADQLTAKKVQIEYPVRDGNGITAAPMSVMHPLHCLQSRASNVVTLKRTNDLARRQLDAASIVLREYVNEALGSGGDDSRARVATSVLKGLHRYLSSDLVGIRVHRASSNNPLDVLRAFADDARLDERYRRNQLAGMIDDVQNRQARLNQQASMAAVRGGFGR